MRFVDRIVVTRLIYTHKNKKKAEIIVLSHKKNIEYTYIYDRLSGKRY